MRRIRSKNTAPELLIRSLIFKSGYRYRLHRKDLPGTPDLVFPKLHKVIFINGCFWHQHKCKEAHIPKSNREYWLPKLEQNITRDKENCKKLRKMGWSVLVLWECKTENLNTLRRKIIEFLNSEIVN
jgi:DNA mismatch endonuclease (patch repair protein)